ncbi:MAG: CHASE2 domain-containing protein [Spirochaetes bacterium]|jgi:adenylate cyclase|nr:CHASE2 domain-containing protein [Spirochaetota bacterium]
MKANSEAQIRRSRLFPTPWYFNLVVAIAVGVISALLAFAPGFRTGNNRLYDALLHLRPAVSEDERIVLVNIDDASVRRQGEWPWRRSVLAEGLWLLSEFAPRSVLLDLDYSDSSPTTVREGATDNGVPALVRQEFGRLTGNLTNLRRALAQDSIPTQALPPLLGDVIAQAEESRERIVSGLRQTRVDNDQALSYAVAANGSVSLPIVMVEREADVEPSLVSAARDAFALSSLDGSLSPDNPAVPPRGGVLPMIEPLLRAADSAGFTNNEIDADGVTRRAHLYASDGSAVFGHFVMPLFHELRGVEAVDAAASRYTIRTEDGTVRIPRLHDGSVLIHWPKDAYLDSFRHLSYSRILDAQQLEADLAFNLEEMDAAGYFAFGNARTTPLELRTLALSTREDMEENGNWGLTSEYRELKRAYLAVVGSFLDGPAEEQMLAQIEERRSQSDVSTEQDAQLSSVADEVRRVFADTRSVYRALSQQRQVLRDAVSEGLVFVGFTATSTTDLGVTPFESEFLNLGVHAAILNTLLSESFLDHAPGWVGAVLALLVPVLVGVLIRGRRPITHVVIGLVVIAAFALGAVLTFVILGIFIPILSMLLAGGLTLAGLTVVALVETERDKRWLHGAFEHYISAEFIDELVHNPDKLDLGGQEQELTAMFTDIRQFTRIAESLAPTDLVALLNRYLTRMSDVLLDERGTIDKYEGDAIIAFFGAPIALSDHARRACEAALRMKRAEEELNVSLLRDSISPQPLYTRIGINTGPMLVGNLGTTRRMDYTIMGHQANVASRLEGANKLYGTWILVSERTQEGLDGAFIFRRLDRVRLDETPVLKEALDTFDDGLSAYEKGDFTYAEARFEQVRKLYPNDGPAMLFEERCASFRGGFESAENWDGVTTLQSK